MIITSAYNGIAQDTFFGDNGECGYMENINIDEMRLEKLDSAFLLNYNTATTFTCNQMVETPSGIITCGNNKIFLNDGDKSATLAGATRVEFTGDTSGLQINYFFDNTSVYKTDNVISTITNTETLPVSGLVTASVLIYNDILYAQGGIIYRYNLTTFTTAPVSLATAIPIISGSTVKYMYFYNDMLVIVATKQDDTYIYQVQYGTSGYEIYSVETIKGYVCTTAIGDRGVIYWITENKIFGFSGGQSQEIRFIGYSDSLAEATFGSLMSVNKGYIQIASGTKLYRWGARNSSRRKNLTVKNFSSAIVGLSSKNIQVQNTVSLTTANRIYLIDSGVYPDSGYTISLPYDAGVYGDEKSGLAFRVGYQLPTGTTITVGVMTDEMEMVSTSTYVTVATISSGRRQMITVDEINTALVGAGYSSDWQYIRFKRTLNGSGGSSGARTRTPKFFDMKLTLTNSNEDLQ